MMMVMILFKCYRKIPIISPALIFVQKLYLAGLFFIFAGGRGDLLLEGVLCFKNGSAYIWKGFYV